MHADNKMWAPLFKCVLAKANAALHEELSRLWPDLVNRPVDVLHPVLLILQRPVVQPNQLLRNVVRFLNSLDDTDTHEWSVPEPLHPFRVGAWIAPLGLILVGAPRPGPGARTVGRGRARTLTWP